MPISLPQEWKPITGEQRALLDEKIAIFDKLQKSYRHNVLSTPVDDDDRNDSLRTEETNESQNNNKPSNNHRQNDDAKVAVSEQREPDVDIEFLQFLKAHGANDQDLLLVGAEMISNR